PETADTKGDWFTSFTTTVKLWVALNGGPPLSVTRTVIAFVDGPCASAGVQLNTPLVGLMTALVGAPASRLNARTLSSASVAEFVNVSVDSSLTILSETAD